jgi:L-serine dehydratase
MHYTSLRELIDEANKREQSIGAIVLEAESEQEYTDIESSRETMRKTWRVMKESIEKGSESNECSRSGLSGGDAFKLLKFSSVYLGKEVSDTVAEALGVAELNACMGKVVACPTAGSCGIVPAALNYAQKKFDLDEEQIINALFTAAGIGIVCSVNASLSGAEGGCQAECGVAAAMASGALVELAGGSPDMIGNAVAICFTNLMGLICDPVAGLVEIPCILRNAGTLIQGILSAEMALAGIESRIPVDEVIEAMGDVGRALPENLRETAEGGLAATETGRKIAEEFGS